MVGAMRSDVSRLCRGWVRPRIKQRRIDMVFCWETGIYTYRKPGEHIKLRKSQKRTIQAINRVMRNRKLRGGPAAVHQFKHGNRSLIFAGPRP